ncbi:phage prohead protease, HK97 family [Myxococcus virescens]|uniref:Phage prohead protease, HK97 family n=3 Tax=Myxococcus virescens TaxID=83456 RepID=A0ABY0N1L9_9BACT|nr:phage prohead protease, HK97 family [Myxococcus virescens]
MRFKRMTAAAPAASGELPVFQACDTEPDRDGDRMLPGALNLEAHAANPVLYWDHGHRQGRLPVGTCRVWEDGSKHFMEPRVSDATQESRDVKALVADGTIRACSIGYITLASRPNEFGGEDVIKAELVEVSLTGIPAKPKALRVKTMTSEEMAKAWKQLVEDVAEAKTLLKALHDKMQSADDTENKSTEEEETEEKSADDTEDKSTEEEETEEEETEESADDTEDKSTEEEDAETVAKFFRGFVTK